MGTEAELALAAGFFGGMFVTAVVLWFHERRTRQVLEDASGRLRRNEARTHALLRESRDVLAIVDRDGTLRYVSPVADRILGRSSAQFSGTTLAALIHPEDRPRVVAALDAPAAPGGRTQRLEFRVQHRDGHWVVLEAAIEDLRHDPAIDGVVMTCRDVSERQRADGDLCEAQERFRATFERKFLQRLVAYVEDAMLERVRGKESEFRSETLRFVADPQIFSDVCELVCEAVYDYLHNDGFLDLPPDWRAKAG